MKWKLWKKLALAFGVVLALGICVCLYGYFVYNAQVFGHIYNHGSREQKVVALTFDDGPNEPYTSRVLDILKENGVHATFFLIGENAEIYPDVARRILAEGNIVGNHSYSHWNHHALTGFGIKDLERNQEALYNLLGIKPHLYRPPYGRKSPWELASLKRNGLIGVNWENFVNDLHIHHTADAYWAGRFAGHIVKDTRPGSIILLHDGYGTVHNSLGGADKSLIVLALPIIIEKLKAEGYGFVTVPELLNIPAYNTETPSAH
jgi:peptidoglycan/xylan/chitin deacetylase (PgdA/CDA1 family)